MSTNRKTIVIVTALIALAALLALAGPADAQQADYATHGTGTDASCATYGCLYEHRTLSHYSRTGPVYEIAYGIAHERLADQPEEYDAGRGGRRFVTVQWPMVNASYRYDPARRAGWDRLAGCESTWQWNINNGNGYHGGLQFSPSTWRAYGGGEFAGAAYNATPEQQITVAERVLWAGHGPHGPQGRGAWPGCRAKGKGAPYAP